MGTMTVNYRGKQITLPVYNYEHKDYRKVAEGIKGIGNIKFNVI